MSFSQRAKGLYGIRASKRTKPRRITNNLGPLARHRSLNLAIAHPDDGCHDK